MYCFSSLEKNDIYSNNYKFCIIIQNEVISCARPVLTIRENEFSEAWNTAGGFSFKYNLRNDMKSTMKAFWYEEEKGICNKHGSDDIWKDSFINGLSHRNGWKLGMQKEKNLKKSQKKGKNIYIFLSS